MYVTGSTVKELEGRWIREGHQQNYINISSQLCIKEFKQNRKSTAYLKSGCLWLAQVLFIDSSILILNSSHLA